MTSKLEHNIAHAIMSATFEGGTAQSGPDAYDSAPNVIATVRAMTPQQQRELLDLDHASVEHIAALIDGQVERDTLYAPALADGPARRVIGPWVQP